MLKYQNEKLKNVYSLCYVDTLILTPEWCSGLRYRKSVLEASLQTPWFKSRLYHSGLRYRISVLEASLQTPWFKSRLYHSGLRHRISVLEASLQTLVQWSKTLHLSARGVTTDTLVQIQAVSHPAVIGSPIGWRTIGPALAGVGRHCK